jgi:hypothetical protein
MEELYSRIINIIHLNDLIELGNENSYRYLRPITTRINGSIFQAFEYEISAQNRKRVPIDLIHSIYQQRLQTGITPSKAEIFTLFPFELCSRPCNYTVAVFIVELLIAENNNTQN